jgi:signal transduction histidine kinase
MNVRDFGLIALVGAASIAAAAASLGMPAIEALTLAGIAGLAALLTGAAGAGLLFALRRRSIGLQVTAVALSSVATVGVGAMAAAQAMFLSAHDLDALLVILLAAGATGALVAKALGHRVTAASRSLERAVRRIGQTDLGTDARQAEGSDRFAPDTSEFAGLAHELDEMSRRLDEAQARERAVDASRRELTAWVSHDLRTPLAGIRAIAEALEDGVVDDPETVARYHRTLRIETDRLARLVDELFELSVIHAGALRLQMERVSLGDLVSDALAASAATARARGVRLQGQLNNSAPELDLAPTEVARVLRNLLENAIRHTPSDGSVWVQAGVEDGDAYVSVADQCGGIPPSDLDRVFDLAFRGEAARTPGEHGGAGLGLAIARGIVEAHHGEITVCNEGPGCRFTVRLPLSQPASR